MSPLSTERRVAIITGGSRGIGRATVLLAARRGFDIFLTYNARKDAADEVVAAAQAHSARAVAAQVEMGDPQSIETMFSVFEGAFGRLDALVNNAGTTGPMTSLSALEIGDLKRVLDINVVGSFVAAKLAARKMSLGSGGNGGAIVNVSSRAAQLGGPNEWLHYAASKGAIDTFTIGLARELGPDGIRVNAVSPGLIDTEIHASSGGGDRLERLAHAVPQGRIGTADEVAEAIVWLIADAPAYVTGSNIQLSGGR